MYSRISPMLKLIHMSANKANIFPAAFPTLQMKGRWASNINVWYRFYVFPEMKLLGLIFPKQNYDVLSPNFPTFMHLWAIYTFPGSICLFCCSQIDRPILGIYINRSEVHECRNWERGPTVLFLGIHKSDFRYSACLSLFFSSGGRKNPACIYLIVQQILQWRHKVWAFLILIILPDILFRQSQPGVGTIVNGILSVATLHENYCFIVLARKWNSYKNGPWKARPLANLQK